MPATPKSTARKSAVPKDETKEARFLRLGAKRLTKALSAIGNVVPLANPRQYGYNKAQADKVIGMLHAAVKDVETAFAAPNAQTKAAVDLNVS